MVALMAYWVVTKSVRAETGSDFSFDRFTAHEAADDRA